jgi:hypothetical protein
MPRLLPPATPQVQQKQHAITKASPPGIPPPSMSSHANSLDILRSRVSSDVVFGSAQAKALSEAGVSQRSYLFVPI